MSIFVNGKKILNATVRLGEGGGSSLSADKFNIAYGETAPSDTTKLWVKSQPKSKISVSALGPPIVETMAEVSGDTKDDSIKSIEQLETVLPMSFNNGYAYLWNGLVYIISDDWSCKLVTFNPETEECTYTSIGANTYGSTFCGVGGCIYVFGGGGVGGLTGYQSAIIRKIDLALQTITTLDTTLPVELCYMSASAAGDNIYIFGGKGASNYYSNNIYVFNTKNETLGTMTAILPTPTAQLASITVDSKIYIFGGAKYDESALYRTDSVEDILIYDPVSDTIVKSAANLFSYTAYLSLANIGNNIYVFGGDNTGGSITNGIKQYNIESDTITSSPVSLLYNSYGPATIALGSKIYLFGGRHSINNSYAPRNIIFVANVNRLIPVVEPDELFIETNGGYKYVDLYSLDTAALTVSVKAVYTGNEESVGSKTEAYLYDDEQRSWVLI